MQFTYHINGMHCSACVEKIKSALGHHYKIVEISLEPPRLIIEAGEEPALSEINSRVSLAGNYSVSASSGEDSSANSFFPIYLIAAYIVGVATLNNVTIEGIDWQGWMPQFMAGFFLVFSAFKFLDLRGFAEGYASYDLLAAKWYPYGYVYPVLELSLGILYLTHSYLILTNLATILIMGFSSLGVIISLQKKKKFQCACLGTVLKVPLSSITLIEDLTMVFMAIIMLMM